MRTLWVKNRMSWEGGYIERQDTNRIVLFLKKQNVLIPNISRRQLKDLCSLFSEFICDKRSKKNGGAYQHKEV